MNTAHLKVEPSHRGAQDEGGHSGALRNHAQPHHLLRHANLALVERCQRVRENEWRQVASGRPSGRPDRGDRHENSLATLRSNTLHNSPNNPLPSTAAVASEPSGTHGFLAILAQKPGFRSCVDSVLIFDVHGILQALKARGPLEREGVFDQPRNFGARVQGAGVSPRRCGTVGTGPSFRGTSNQRVHLMRPRT